MVSSAVPSLETFLEQEVWANDDLELQYMWADAGVFGVFSMNKFAEGNPLRWSRPQIPKDMCAELESLPIRDRPVKLAVIISNERLLRTFDDAHKCAQWTRSTFANGATKRERVAHIRATFSAGGLFASCSRAPSVSSEICTDDRGVAFLESEYSPSSELTIARSEVTPADTIKLRYMWADARIMPIPGMSSLAQANPLRWSSAESPEEFVGTLKALTDKNRPVIVSTVASSPLIKHEFATVDEAMEWVSDTFNCGRSSVSLEASGSTAIDESEHICVICQTAPVEVMLMPCRHAVLCDECTQTLLANGGGCPICRTGIQNFARGSFASDYVDLVVAMEARLERSRDSVYDGMYNHIRPLMFFGALLGTGAVACFVVAPVAAPAGVALAGTSLAVGYIPWFLTTAARFESEGETDDDQASSARFLSREDLTHPIRLVTKLGLMATVGPVAAVVFFVPYGLYAGVLRPLSRAALSSLLRASCFLHVYATRPLASALAAFGRCIVGTAQGLARFVGRSVVTAAQSVHAAIVASGHCIWNNVIVPIGNVTKRVACGLGNCIVAVSRTAFTYVIRPCGNALYAACCALANGIATGAAHVYKKVILPCGTVALGIGRFVGRGASALANGLAAGAVAIYTYVILPCGTAALVAGRFVGRGASALASGLASGAVAIYTHVILPCGTAALAIGNALASSVAAGAVATYTYVILPCGTAALAMGSALASVVAAGAVATYTYVILPCGTAALATGRFAGRCASALASCFAAGAVGTYTYVISPVGRGAAIAAEAIYTYVVSPCGRAVLATGTSVASAIQTVVSAIARQTYAFAEAVYVYVVLPGGRAVRLAIVNTGHGIQVCCTQIRNAAVSVSASVRAAGRQSMDAFQSARL